MKLTFETKINNDHDLEVEITLDGKSVKVKQVPFGAKCDLSELPESVGKVILEETWTLGEKLIRIEGEFDEIWGGADDDSLESISRLF